MNRRIFASNLVFNGLTYAGAIALLGASSTVAAQRIPAEGVDFTKVDPLVPLLARNKIEVLEFFSYECPVCNAFEPRIEAWTKRAPSDVLFSRIPVPFLRNSDNFMRIYYALDQLGKVDLMQSKVFDLVHLEHKSLDKPAEIVSLAKRLDIEPAKFLSTFNSFTVANSITRGKRLCERYNIDSVPTLAVQGRFSTSPALAGNFDRALEVVDYLVQRAQHGL